MNKFRYWLNILKNIPNPTITLLTAIAICLYVFHVQENISLQIHFHNQDLLATTKKLNHMLDNMDSKLKNIDSKLDHIESKLGYMNSTLDDTDSKLKVN